MKHTIYENTQELGAAAAALGASAIRRAAAEKDRVNIILATGASQFTMLAQLVQYTDLPWEKIFAFHLDEYIGIPQSHPASFRKYLNDRFVSKTPVLGAFIR